jgi:hypothetical protein
MAGDHERRFQVSRKELAQLVLSVNTLPFPPIPVNVDIKTTEEFPETHRKALNLATSAMVQECKTGCEYVSSHNAVAALMLYHRWSGALGDAARKEEVQSVKGRLVLELITDFCGESKTQQSDTPRVEFLYEAFQRITKAWLESYATTGLDIAVGFPARVSIAHESPLHAAMAGYCYTQGFVYSQKNEKLRCPTHEQVKAEYERMTREEAEEGDAQAMDDAGCRAMEMEMTRIYGRSEYEALLALCGTRIMKDTLYGFVPENTETQLSVAEQAEALARMAVQTCDRLSAERAQAVCEGDANVSETTLERGANVSEVVTAPDECERDATVSKITLEPGASVSEVVTAPDECEVP